MWKTINDVLGRSRKTDKTQQIKLTDGTLINNSEEIATEFIKYFNTIPHEFGQLCRLRRRIILTLFQLIIGLCLLPLQLHLMF